MPVALGVATISAGGAGGVRGKIRVMFEGSDRSPNGPTVRTWKWRTVTPASASTIGSIKTTLSPKVAAPMSAVARVSTFLPARANSRGSSAGGPGSTTGAVGAAGAVPAGPGGTAVPTDPGATIGSVTVGVVGVVSVVAVPAVAGAPSAGASALGASAVAGAVPAPAAGTAGVAPTGRSASHTSTLVMPPSACPPGVAV